MFKAFEVTSSQAEGRRDKRKDKDMPTGMKYIIVTLVAVNMALTIFVLMFRAAHAMHPQPDGRGYDDNLAEPICQVVYALDQHPVSLPAKMCEGPVNVQTVWFECEVANWWMQWDTPAEAVNPVSGARGIAQIMPSWERNPRAAIDFYRLGLDYNSERDRLIFAGELWLRVGWGDWQCSY